MIFEAWDVALARFPFVETTRHKLRPVVILSSADYNASHDLLLVLMITSAPQGRWSSDHEIVDLPAAGLRQACFARFKIATIATVFVDRRLGRLAQDDVRAIRLQLTRFLPLGAPS